MQQDILPLTVSLGETVVFQGFPQKKWPTWCNIYNFNRKANIYKTKQKHVWYFLLTGWYYTTYDSSNDLLRYMSLTL